MFDLIDLIVAPLVELNPVKYLTDAAYRKRKEHELGVRAKRIFCYQVVVSVAGIATLIALASFLA